MRDVDSTMQRKILFSPQELGVKVTIYPQIPPEFTQIAWGLTHKCGRLGGYEGEKLGETEDLG